MSNKNKQFAVLGLGRFGQAVVHTLAENGCDVMCCDKDMEIVQEMSQYVTEAIQVNVTNSKAMQSIGLGDYDCVIIAIGDSFESTIMAAMCAKEANVPLVIAKARTDQQKALLKKIGVDKVVMPEKDSGVRMALNLITTNILEYVQFSDKYAIAEISPLKKWLGKDFAQSNIRAEYGLNIVAIKRGGEVIVSPEPKTVITENDILVVIGENKKIQGLS